MHQPYSWSECLRRFGGQLVRTDGAGDSQRPHRGSGRVFARENVEDYEEITRYVIMEIVPCRNMESRWEIKNDTSLSH